MRRITGTWRRRLRLAALVLTLSLGVSLASLPAAAFAASGTALDAHVHRMLWSVSKTNVLRRFDFDLQVKIRWRWLDSSAPQQRREVTSMIGEMVCQALHQVSHWIVREADR